MHKSRSRPRSAALFLGAAFLLLLVGGGILAWLMAKQGVRAPLRVLLVAPSPVVDGAPGVPEGRAINALIQDLLEHQGGFAVTSVTELPADLESFRAQARTLLLQPSLRRQGDDLELSYRYVWGRQIPKGAAVPWVEHRAEALPPVKAMAAFLASFPQVVQGPGGNLVPKTAKVFWTLIQAGAWRLQNHHLDQALVLAEQATLQEPDCASAWILLGNLRYRRLLNSPAASRRDHSDTEAALQRGLALAPNHPRGALLLSLMKADIGDQGEALDLLLRARRKQPFNPSLLTGIGYAARNAGLLPMARRAMDIRDNLAFARLQPQAVDITCLYTGEISRFEANLQDQPGHLRSASGVLPFYRGYLALIQGHRKQAQGEFRAVARLENGYPNILRLSEIYDLVLDGRKKEAWKKLQAYDLERTGMREPDGEFTIRLAEAYALMGDRASAMDMALRAFGRGFGCTAWYERSPMLEPLRSLPKWKALMQHLNERQSLMEDRFPVGLLEEN